MADVRLAHAQATGNGRREIGSGIVKDQQDGNKNTSKPEGRLPANGEGEIAAMWLNIAESGEKIIRRNMPHTRMLEGLARRRMVAHIPQRNGWPSVKGSVIGVCAAGRRMLLSR